jgi:hypothetical protein
LPRLLQVYRDECAAPHGGSPLPHLHPLHGVRQGACRLLLISPYLYCSCKDIGMYLSITSGLYDGQNCYPPPFPSLNRTSHSVQCFGSAFV